MKIGSALEFKLFFPLIPAREKVKTRSKRRSMSPRQHLKNQKGFTLVEIIAVLILLGILAAVAIPRYMNLTDQARQSAAQAAIAEAKSRLASGYGIELMQSSGATPVMTAILAEGAMTSATAMTIGDFRLTPTISGTAVRISVSAVQGTALAAAVQDTWTRP